jgi:hypothetical protein
LTTQTQVVILGHAITTENNPNFPRIVQAWEEFALAHSFAACAYKVGSNLPGFFTIVSPKLLAFLPA